MVQARPDCCLQLLAMLTVPQLCWPLRGGRPPRCDGLRKHDQLSDPVTMRRPVEPAALGRAHDYEDVTRRVIAGVTLQGGGRAGEQGWLDAVPRMRVCLCCLRVQRKVGCPHVTNSQYA